MTIPLNFTVGPELPPPPAPALQFAATLTVWNCSIEYLFDMGLRSVPPCGPAGTPTRFVRQKTSYCAKLISWVAGAFGGIPQLPSSDLVQANDVLMHVRLASPTVGKTVSGDPVWSVMGFYAYACQQPFQLGVDTLSFSAGPFAPQDNVTQNVIPAFAFATNYMGPASRPANFNGSTITF